MNIIDTGNSNTQQARNLALHEIALRSLSFAAASNRTSAVTEFNDRLSAVSGPARDSMFTDVPVVKVREEEPSGQAVFISRLM